MPLKINDASFLPCLLKMRRLSNRGVEFVFSLFAQIFAIENVLQLLVNQTTSHIGILQKATSIKFKTICN